MIFCATGDSIFLKDFKEGYEGFKKLSEYIKSADVRINNLETVVSDFECFASTFCGGTWINTRPQLLDKLCWFGFNYFGIANNHTMDYSYDGLRSTIKELEKRKLTYSGAGMNLEEASKHAVVETAKGKVVATPFQGKEFFL